MGSEKICKRRTGIDTENVKKRTETPSTQPDPPGYLGTNKREEKLDAWLRSCRA